MRRTLKRFISDEQGAILVEMTLLTPFMLVLSAGVFEFSNVIHTRLLVEAGVTDAARFYARCRHTEDDAAACATAAKSLAVTAADGSTRVSNWSTGQITVDDCSISGSSTYPCIATSVIDADTGETNYRSNSGSVITVRVATTMPYPDSGLLAYIGVSSLNITVANEQRVLGW